MMTLALSITISCLAILFAVLKIPFLQSQRTFLVLFALGAGQIHLAYLALILFLFTELGFRFPHRLHRRSFTIIIGFYACVVLVTITSPVDIRTVTETIKLFVYIFIFFQIQAILSREGMTECILRMSAYASLVMASLGLIFTNLGFTETPHIFLERGANEGSTFLLLMGVVPCIFLLMKTQKLKFLLVALIITYAQYVATSRANYFLSGFCILSIFFFSISQLRIRIILTLIFSTLIILNLPYIMQFIEGEQNYSTLQRILLYELGYKIASEHPWLGWGWGSTFKLVSANTLTDIDYPHFHSTFIQLWVELGVFGLIIIGLWTVSLVWSITKGCYSKISNEYNSYIALSSVVIFFSGFTEALIFGADRAIQIVIMFAIYIKILKSNKKLKYKN